MWWLRVSTLGPRSGAVLPRWTVARPRCVPGLSTVGEWLVHGSCTWYQIERVCGIVAWRGRRPGRRAGRRPRAERRVPSGGSRAAGPERRVPSGGSRAAGPRGGGPGRRRPAAGLAVEPFSAKTTPLWQLGGVRGRRRPESGSGGVEPGAGRAWRRVLIRRSARVERPNLAYVPQRRRSGGVPRRFGARARARRSGRGARAQARPRARARGSGAAAVSAR